MPGRLKATDGGNTAKFKAFYLRGNAGKNRTSYYLHIFVLSAFCYLGIFVYGLIVKNRCTVKIMEI